MSPEHFNTFYLFCGRRSDRIKAILHEKDGFVLLYKKLDSRVGRYHWLRNKDEVKSISWEQFEWLMDGLEIEQSKAIKTTGNHLILLGFLRYICYNIGY